MPKRRKRQRRQWREEEPQCQIPIPSTSIMTGINHDIYSLFEEIEAEPKPGLSLMNPSPNAADSPCPCPLHRPPSHWLNYIPTYYNRNHPRAHAQGKGADYHLEASQSVSKNAISSCSSGSSSSLLEPTPLPTPTPTSQVMSESTTSIHTDQSKSPFHEAEDNRHYYDHPDPKTEEEIATLLSHLNELKSNLMPYSKIVSDLKRETFSHRARTSPQNEFRRASRDISVNPYEFLYFTFDDATDGSGSGTGTSTDLISRSALKLCNMDALAGFIFRGKGKGKGTENGVGSHVEKEIFIDLCGAPGGFSQYLLHCGYSKGYGMSLRGKSVSGDSVGVEWDVGDLDPSKFIVHDGEDGTGDIYNWQNVMSLRKRMRMENDVISTTRGRAAVVVADGGIDAQRNATDQENVANRLVICQAAAAIYLLDTGGTFVLKMFGFRSKSCQGLMDFLSRIFDKMMVLKPVTSRPASAERYLFCTGFKGIGRDFDVLRWRDELIGGEDYVSTGTRTHDQESSDLTNFLKKVDYAILSLNIRACTKIIGCLREEEEKLLHVRSSKKKKCRSNDGVVLNIAYLKEQWRIGTHTAD